MADLKFKSLTQKKEGNKIIFEIEFANLNDFDEDYATKKAAEIVSILKGG
jgi:hypothetical protein